MQGGRLSLMLIAVMISTGCNVDPSGPTPTTYQWYGELVDKQPSWETLGAEAAFLWQDNTGQMVALAAVTTDTPGAVRPWQIRQNRCTDDGPVLGSAALYPDIVVDSAGEGVVQSPIFEIALNPGGSYHARIFLSPESPETLIACINLELQT